MKRNVVIASAGLVAAILLISFGFYSVLATISVLMFFGCLIGAPILAAVKRRWAFLGWGMAAAIGGLLIFDWAVDKDAMKEGFLSHQDRNAANKAGFRDAVAWAKEHDRIDAELAEARKEARAKARKEAAEETVRKEKEAAEEKARRDKEAAEKKEKAATAFAGSYQGQVSVVQKQFIQAIEKARADYAAADNDMVRGGTRTARAKAVCAALKGQPDIEWVGQITTLSSNGDGHGVLAVSVGPNITFKTCNNNFSDIWFKTLIDPESLLFDKASKHKKGDVVTVRGKLFPNPPDCIQETSLTLRGSIADPEYIFRFTDVTAAE